MENLSQPTHDCPRQGDILFIPCSLPLENLVEKRDGIIAEGEVTGHHHRLGNLKKAVVLVAKDWAGKVTAMFVRVFNEGADVVHEEHGTIHLPPGDYRVNQAREYDYLSESERQVAD
jgi:hypothetical protein